MDIKNQIRGAVVISNPRIPELYRGLWIGRNFYLYRLVLAGCKFQGHHYDEDTLVRVYAEKVMPEDEPVPEILTRRD